MERERRGLSTAVGLTLSGRIFKRYFAGSMTSAHVVVMLTHLLRFLPQGFVLVWDHATIHLHGRTPAFLAEQPEIMAELLPTYAPELNPEEYCHGNVKRYLKNATPANIHEICQMLDRGFARLRRRPDLLLHFIQQAGLRVKQLWLP